jgi:hypothetical protein
VLLAGTACTAEESSAPEPPEVTPTPISEFDAAGTTLARVEFCDRIPEESVRVAVGKVDSTDHYGNGEKDRITDGVRDVAHEFSCTFTGDTGVQARAWVFVPRVTRAQAKQLVRDARRTKGCEEVPDEGFGKPGAGLVCRSPEGDEASYRGLFTDTWFSCSLRAADLDRATLLDQAGQWCVSAASAATVR